VVSRMTGFSSTEHGFRFVNSFQLPAALQHILPSRSASHLGLSDLLYGLCGGMCFAALDYFHAGKPVPDVWRADEISDALFSHLVTRQVDSLRRGVVLKVLAWMARSDISLARSVAGWEAAKVRAQVDAGQPPVLALIRVKGLSDPMCNHQVLATGYDYDPDTKEMAIQLYDPNHPARTPYLTMNLTRPSEGIRLTQSTGEPLRGFFVIAYTPETPP